MEKQKWRETEGVIENTLPVCQRTKKQDLAIKRVLDHIEEMTGWRTRINKIKIYKPTGKDVKYLLKKVLESSANPLFIVSSSGQVKHLGNPDLWHNFSMLCRLKQEKMKECEVKDLAETKKKYRKAVKQIMSAYAVVYIADSTYYAGSEIY